MPKEITPLSAVLATFVAANSYSAFKHLRGAAPSGCRGWAMARSWWRH